MAGLLPQAGPGPVLATLACNVLLGALPVVFVVSSSLMMGRIPDALAAGTGSAQWSAVMAVFVVASAAFALQQVMAPFQEVLGELVARRIDGRLYDRLITASLQGPGIGPLEDQRLLAHLSEARRGLESGADSPGKACAGLLHLLLRGVQLAGCVVVIGFCFSWPAALGLLVAVQALRHGLHSGLRKHTESWAALAGLRREERYLRDLATRAEAGKEIRIFGMADWLRDRHRRASLAWMVPAWAERRRLLLWPYLGYTAFGLVVTAAVLAAVAAAGAGNISLTALALTTQAVLVGIRLGGFAPESDMQMILGMGAHRALTAFEQGVERFAAREAAWADGPGRTETLASAPLGEIRFSKVSFSYPNREQRVFDGLDLRIVAGRCTAIVGVNGAGKTTLVKLLTRLCEPDEGLITVDGRPLASYPVAAWRARVAVVFQDFNRYEASAFDNVGYGDIQRKGAAAAREEIRAAARDAGVADALDALPGGFETPLAKHLSGGADLSGGQWQRVALARALFRLRHGGGVLVLDEPTASLDVRAEARFFQEFVRGDATTVLISHRFSTVRHADHIVVLAHGQVSEEGTHDELLHNNGEYARLFRLQAYRFAEDRPSPDIPGAHI
ncbi:ABC transporter ATP-binding protein [Streptomyces sp. NEAU-W12]|uniref:ABC transporter ATP-binding protein n=1 Tax=Streptomyces sp. NEAU-W12 TaxID=2994668 RepID=UPI00224AE379|nr:ABC transporter ATP-binding protein [Streptomyces sp. NEAU-W12]MCX2926049.1 ABC transporter ATP-binding protein [Streptomyces sp. NEAU-W12]